MMVQPSGAPVFPPISVISPEFIAPESLEMIVDKYPCRSLLITDINHKILLKVKPCDTTFHRQRVLLDANDKTIAMLRDKGMSMHSRWNVFKGESKSDSDMIFSASKEHALFQFKINIRVMLAKRSNESCDFRIKGSWSKGNFTIYMGDSSTAIAEMSKPQALKYAAEKFTVTIQPNMDYAFVIALFAIVDAIENPDEVKKGSSGSVGVALDVLGAVGSLGN